MMRRTLYDLKNRVLSVYQKFINKRFFLYDDVVLRQFVHWYNKTWTNSRSIELPVFFEILKRCSGERVLEVGNVLGHYRKTSHDVLDKYEMGMGVINEDVVSYKPGEKYDIVLSCSTLEHVGFDEEDKDPDGFVKAINNIMTNILKPGGVLVFSVPVGYNSGLDKALRENRVRFYSVTHYSQDGWHIILGVTKK
jgi:SAM-dependent methyltransferase